MLTKTNVLLATSLVLAIFASAIIAGQLHKSADATLQPIGQAGQEGTVLVNCPSGEVVVAVPGSGVQKAAVVQCRPGRADGPPVVTSSYVEPRRTEVVRTTPIATTTRARRHRAWEQEALIVGGSAGAGAGIGAIAGGKKGTAIGAASGGVAGLIYDLATRNK